VPFVDLVRDGRCDAVRAAIDKGASLDLIERGARLDVTGRTATCVPGTPT